MACRILLADDDQDDRFLMEEAFEKIGLVNEIHQVESGLKLLNYLNALTNDKELPVLIVLDLNMPLLDGIETLSSIKSNSRYKDIPVFIHSTTVNEKEKAKCINLGATGFLVKPHTFEQFLNTAKYLHECSIGLTAS